jgi:hypothetical protein
MLGLVVQFRFWNCYNEFITGIFLAVTFLVLAPFLSYAQPAVEFTKVDHDFGTFTNENEAEHVFEVLNGGDEGILIERLVKSSCTIKAAVNSVAKKPNITVEIFTSVSKSETRSEQRFLSIRNSSTHAV